MESAGACGAMIVHPDIAGFEREILRLRVSLSEAIRKLTYMEAVEGPYLRLLYVQQLGKIQVEVMELQAEVAVLRRQIDAITARLNRGEIVTAEWLNGLQTKISGEIQELLDEILRRKNECREVEQGPGEFEKIDRERGMKLKAIYRELCRALHPDMGLADRAVFEVWWEDIQLAYTNGDLEQLESIALALDVRSPNVSSSGEGLAGAVVGGGSGGGMGGESRGAEESKGKERVVARGSLEVLGREKERLQDCLQGYLGKIEKLKGQPPFSYAELIMNPEIMEERYQDFCAQKQAFGQRKAYLEEQLADLLKAFHIVEKTSFDAGSNV